MVRPYPFHGIVDLLTDHFTLNLDINQYEDSGGSADLPVAIFAKSEKIITAQMDSKVPLHTFEKVLRTAMDGCQLIYQALVECVREHSLNLVASSRVVNA